MKKVIIVNLFILLSLTAISKPNDNPFMVLESGKTYMLQFKDYDYSGYNYNHFAIYSDRPDHYRVNSWTEGRITKFLAITNMWGFSDARLNVLKYDPSKYPDKDKIFTTDPMYLLDFSCTNLPGKMVKDKHFRQDELGLMGDFTWEEI